MSKLAEIEKSIITAIKNQEFLAGDKIMSENELLNKFSVSRMTSRKAILNLVSKGYLYQKKGSGTYVASRDNNIEIHLSEMIGFADRLKKIGKNPITKILSFKTIKSYPSLSEILKIETNKKIYYIVRARYMDNIPIALEYSYMPFNLIADMKKEDVEISKYAYLKKWDLK